MKNKLPIGLTLLALLAALPAAAPAQAQQIVIGGKGKLQISPDQKLMFEAANRVVQHDFKGAEALYTQAIQMNGGNINAYIQRGIVRREMGDMGGATSDGSAAAALANDGLQANSNSAELYYERGMGYRLARHFPQARQDIEHAMRMPGAQSGWDADLKAIDFEEKETQ